MNKKDLINLEEQIISTVHKALKLVDYEALKDEVNSRTGEAVNHFKTKYKNYKEIKKQPKKYDITKYITKRPVGNTAGTLCIVFGAIGTAGFGLTLLILAIVNFAVGGMWGGQLLLGLFGMLSGVSVLLLGKGMSLKKRIQRFTKYVRLIDNRTHIRIDELAKLSAESPKYLVKDLKKMIEVEMFLQGHIDEEKKYFILTDEVYHQYLAVKRQDEVDNPKQASTEEVKQAKQMAKKAKEEKQNRQAGAKQNQAQSSQTKEERDKKESQEQVLGQIKKDIDQIMGIRNELYKEEIAKKLDKLLESSGQILEQVTKQPEKLSEINKFINHYLPSVIKLITLYKEINTQVVPGSNREATKNEIEKSIDMINEAFQNLADDLFKDIALDISTDISVLKTLFKQDGLTSEEF